MFRVQCWYHFKQHNSSGRTKLKEESEKGKGASIAILCFILEIDAAGNKHKKYIRANGLTICYMCKY